MKTKPRPRSRSSWQLQEAKNRFSEVVRQSALHGPQAITVHGVPKAYVVSIEQYNSWNGKKPTLGEYLLNSPAHGIGFELERIEEPVRDIDL